MFSRADFIVSSEQAREQLHSDSIGIDKRLRMPALEDLIIAASGGVVDIVTALALDLNNDLRYVRKPTETALWQWYATAGPGPSSRHAMNPNIPRSMIRLIRRCLAYAPNSASVLNVMEKRASDELLDRGFVSRDQDSCRDFGRVRVNSPYAEKCLLFEGRFLYSTEMFEKPRHLLSVLGRMSSSELNESMAVAQPKPQAFAIAFREHFLPALAYHGWEYLCPELIRVFPRVGSDDQGDATSCSEVDYCLASTSSSTNDDDDDDCEKRLYGVQLRVNSLSDASHEAQPPQFARFGPSGRYAALAVDDFLMVDVWYLSGGASLAPTSIRRGHRRATVVFRDGVTTQCECLLGIRKPAKQVVLQP